MELHFKYEGMLSHFFDRFYVVTKFILPTINDLKFSLIESDLSCNYLNVDLDRQQSPTLYLDIVKIWIWNYFEIRGNAITLL